MLLLKSLLLLRHLKNFVILLGAYHITSHFLVKDESSEMVQTMFTKIFLPTSFVSVSFPIASDRHFRIECQIELDICCVDRENSD